MFVQFVAVDWNVNIIGNGLSHIRPWSLASFLIYTFRSDLNQFHYLTNFFLKPWLYILDSSIEYYSISTHFHNKLTFAPPLFFLRCCFSPDYSLH